MTPEVIAILGVGAALLAVLVPLHLHLSGRIDAMAARFDAVAREHGERLARIETRLNHIETRLDRLEGLLPASPEPPATPTS